MKILFVKILLVTATQEESGSIDSVQKLRRIFPELEILITGIGMVKATSSLAFAIYNKKPDFILHTGICGSFNKLYPIGTVLNVLSEEFADIGHNDNGKFVPLPEKDQPFDNGKLKNSMNWGKILKLLLENRRTEQEMIEELKVEKKRAKSILDSLEKEGFIEKKKDVFVLKS